jgi:ribosomal protein L11 methylase PrmA
MERSDGTAKDVVKGSFRDPFGFVVQDKDWIVRYITAAGIPAFDGVRKTGFLDRLVNENRLVPFVDVEVPTSDAGLHGYMIEKALRHPKLPFISYPYEWSFSALKTAALFHLDLLLDGIGCCVMMRDASAFNVQFKETRPIFIDHLSFEPYREGQYWVGHDQFCRQFLNPLLVEALTSINPSAWYRGSPDGLSSSEVYRILPRTSRMRPSIFLNVGLPQKLSSERGLKKAAVIRDKKPLSKFALTGVLQQMRALVSSLKLRKAQSVWSDYTAQRNYTGRALEAKSRFVQTNIAQCQPTTLWDLGCNTGEFAELALKAGAQFVVGFDSDKLALEGAYARSTQRNLNLLPLHANLLNPTPAVGWRGLERPSLLQRANADFVLALALVHHLGFSGNVPLHEIVDLIMSLAPEGIIEFVPKSDPMVQRLLALRDDVFPYYNEDVFRAAIATRGQILSEMRVPESERLLVRYSRQ